MIQGVRYRWRVMFGTLSCMAVVALVSQLYDGNEALQTAERHPQQGRQILQSALKSGQGGAGRSSDQEIASSAWRENRTQRLKDLPTVYVITPTYTRYMQKAELTRLCYTFIRVPTLHWIVIEDADKKTGLVERFMKRCGVPYTHLNAPTPEKYRLSNFKSRHQVPRGVNQRNAGLDWLQDQFTINGTRVSSKANGVVYFADDDNTYEIQVFEEMRYTRKVSAWPVAFVGGLVVEKPIVGADGKVKKWNSLHKPERPYPMDMAGFAINLRLLLKHPTARFTYKAKPAYQESVILGRLGVPFQEFEIKADNATKVYVWHTRAEKVLPKLEKKLSVHSDAGMEV